MASSTGQRLSREDYKKKRELEELRKAGAAPPELDNEGKMINPHIPQYISEAPWYLNDGQPGLHHQRQNREPKNYAKLDEWFPRGQKKGVASKKWRKGSCENCGALTHKTRDCVERRRKKGARWTNTDIQPDEMIGKNLKFDFEGKRDRWNGYNIDNHRTVMEFHRKVDRARRRKKAAELDEALKTGKKESKLERQQKRIARTKRDSETDSDSDDDSDSDSDDMRDDGKLIQSMDAKKRLTVRNLRIREDTAKYLHNLDVNSAHYDPKTRSMRQNPHPNQDPSELMYAGDNFSRFDGESDDFINIQQFAWEATERAPESQKGVVHVPSNPSKTEYIYKHFKEQQKKLKTSHKKELVDTYGGAEHFKVPPKQMLFAQSEHYAEFTGDGRVIKSREKVIPTSKYIENEFYENHTAVWGSYYDKAQKKWGYACCHILVRANACTGLEESKRKKMKVDNVRRVAVAPAPKPKAKRKKQSVHELRAAQQTSLLAVGGGRKDKKRGHADISE